LPVTVAEGAKDVALEADSAGDVVAQRLGGRLPGFGVARLRVAQAPVAEHGLDVRGAHELFKPCAAVGDTGRCARPGVGGAARGVGCGWRGGAGGTRVVATCAAVVLTPDGGHLALAVKKVGARGVFLGGLLVVVAAAVPRGAGAADHLHWRLRGRGNGAAQAARLLAHAL